MHDYSSTETTMVPGALRGYRTWRLSGQGLVAVAKNYNWFAGVNVASCHRHPNNAAPCQDCSCGLYAKHGPAQVVAEFGTDNTIGTIKAYGKVVLGTAGFRAEKAEIESIYLPPRLATYAASFLADLYNVPVFTSLRELILKFPPIPVDHLIDVYEELISSGPAVTGLWGPYVGHPSALTRDWLKMQQDWQKALDNLIEEG